MLGTSTFADGQPKKMSKRQSPSICAQSQRSTSARTLPRRTTINFQDRTGNLSHEDIVRSARQAIRSSEIKAGL